MMAPGRQAVGKVKEPNGIDVEVGARLRSQRKRLGMTQAKLAGALGITFQQVQKYKRGIRASRLRSIAGVLSVPISFFFDDHSKNSNGVGPLALCGDARDLVAFLETAEAQELNLAFGRIRSSAARKRVVELVKAVANSISNEKCEMPAGFNRDHAGRG